MLHGGSYMHSRTSLERLFKCSWHIHTQKKTSQSGVCMRQKKKRVCAADHTSIQIGIAWTPLQLFTRNYKTSWSETMRVDVVKQKLDLRGRLHLYSNTHRLNAFSAVLDTYTRNKENGMSEKAGVRMREETSTHFQVVHRRLHTWLTCAHMLVSLDVRLRPFAALFSKVVHLSRVFTVSVLAR